MKKLIWKAAIAIAVFTMGANVNAQSSFEGKITMKIEYEEVPEEYEPYMSMFAKEAITYVKGNKTRSEQASTMGSNVTIMNGETGEGVLLSSMMGQKIAMKMNDSTSKSADTLKPVITYSNETKEIAGYKCKKAELKYGEEDPIEVWYTEELETGGKSSFSGLKGTPMQYTVSERGMVMVMTVTNVSKETVSDDKFIVPEGYTYKTKEELMKMGTGG